MNFSHVSYENISFVSGSWNTYFPLITNELRRVPTGRSKWSKHNVGEYNCQYHGGIPSDLTFSHSLDPQRTLVDTADGLALPSFLD